MASTQDPPGGLSQSDFESMTLDAAGWVWGTVQGAFNDKASTSQIIVDAVIGMIPLVGDVTAVRDLIAVTIGLVDDPKKREEKMQWLMLTLLVVALIPVIGGVVKGVGRLALKATAEAAKLASASARTAHLAAAANDIIAFLNRVGVGNAEQWLLALKFGEYQARILERMGAFVDTLQHVLTSIGNRFHFFIPDSFLKRIEWLKEGLRSLMKTANEMIPQAIKDLDAMLTDIQRYVRAGGETTSRATSHLVESGAKNVSLAHEARIVEEGAGAERTAWEGFTRNPSKKGKFDHIYQPEPGYPDLLSHYAQGEFPNVATYAGKIVNRPLMPGEQIYRVFGPGGATRGASVGTSKAAGNRAVGFWGVGHVPESGAVWRNESAVLDEWNRDGFIALGSVQAPEGVKGCVGKIAGQASGKIKGQRLMGGGTQAMLEFPDHVAKNLNALGEKVMQTGIPVTAELGGVLWEIRPTGWKGVNGVTGYVPSLVPERLAVTVIRLEEEEKVKKGHN